MILSVVPLGLMVVEIRCPCFPGQHVSAVALVPQDAVHRGFRPVRAVPSAYLPQPGFPAQVVQRFRDLRRGTPVQQHVIHEPDGIRFVLVDE